MTANGECGEVGRRDLFGGKAENDEWCKSTQSFRAVVESFHAAAVTVKGGERSWISAAVSLSMTSIGPPHLGQSQSCRKGLRDSKIISRIRKDIRLRSRNKGEVPVLAKLSRPRKRRNYPGGSILVRSTTR
jgi:hypothetical protein